MQKARALCSFFPFSCLFLCLTVCFLYLSTISLKVFFPFSHSISFYFWVYTCGVLIATVIVYFVFSFVLFVFVPFRISFSIAFSSSLFFCVLMFSFVTLVTLYVMETWLVVMLGLCFRFSRQRVMTVKISLIGMGVFCTVFLYDCRSRLFPEYTRKNVFTKCTLN